MLAADHKHGFDPRIGIDAETIVAEHDWAAKEISIGAVNKGLGSVNQLQAALDATAKSGALLVMKFERDGCKACAQTTELLAATAKEFGDAGLFFTVSFDEQKALCRQAKLRCRHQ